MLSLNAGVPGKPCDNDLGQHAQIQRTARNGIAGGDRRMGMHDRVDIRTHLVDGQVHQDLAGGVADAGKFVAFQIANQQVLGG
jgi:hypothetical protein